MARLRLVRGPRPPSETPVPVEPAAPADPADTIFELQTFNKEPLTDRGNELKQYSQDWTPSRTERTLAGNRHQVWWRLNPASAWKKHPKVETFNHQGVVLSIGSDVAVCMSEDSIEQDTVEKDRKKILYARILEMRRVSSTFCHLRVYWYYWPEDLSAGRENWHGVDELIATKHMAIINTDNVSQLSSVVRMQDLGEVAKDIEHYWRQEYDYITGNLSPVTDMCICRSPQNPDNLIVSCIGEGRPHHLECLKEVACKYQWVAMGNSFQFPKDKAAKVSTSKDVQARAPKSNYPWHGILKAELEYKDAAKMEPTYFAWVYHLKRRDVPPVRVPLCCSLCNEVLDREESPAKDPGLTFRDRPRTPSPKRNISLDTMTPGKRKRDLTRHRVTSAQSPPRSPRTPIDSAYSSTDTRSPSSSEDEPRSMQHYHRHRKMSKTDIPTLPADTPIKNEYSLPQSASRRRSMISKEIQPLSREDALRALAAQGTPYTSPSDMPRPPAPRKTPQTPSRRKPALTEKERHDLSPYNPDGKEPDFGALRTMTAKMAQKAGRKTM